MVPTEYTTPTCRAIQNCLLICTLLLLYKCHITFLHGHFRASAIHRTVVENIRPSSDGGRPQPGAEHLLRHATQDVGSSGINHVIACDSPPMRTLYRNKVINVVRVLIKSYWFKFGHLQKNKNNNKNKQKQ